MDGLVSPDRKPHTGLKEYKNVARPLRATYENGCIFLTNTMDFSNVADILRIRWELSVNHRVASYGVVEDFSLRPHEVRQLELDLGKWQEEMGYVSLMLRYEQKLATQMLPVGFERGFDQILLNKPAIILCTACREKAEVLQEGRKLYVCGRDYSYRFDLWHGVPDEIVVKGRNILSEPMRYNFWRAPADNDRKIAAQWYAAGYDRLKIRVYNHEIFTDQEGTHVGFHFGAAGVFLQNALKVQAEYTIGDGGTLRIQMRGCRDLQFPYLPRFGIRVTLPEEFEQVSYIGYGPYESYVDKHRASWFGYFHALVDDLHVDYIMPQENGGHWGCDNLELSDGKRRIEVTGRSFTFHVSHYSQEQLEAAKHNFELEKENKTFLSIDGRMSGLGSGSCGPFLMEKYQVYERNPIMDVCIKFG